MNFMKRFVSGLGAQAAPFGFGLDNPDTQYRAGLSFIGDVGANMLANNQGGRDPWTNLGMSMQEAKAGSLVRNRQAMAAQQMMQEAEDNRRKREEEAAAKKQREDWISTLPPEQQGLARLFPEKFGAELIAEQFPDPVNTSVKSYAPIPYDMGDGQIGYGIPMEDGTFRPVQAPDGTQFLGPYEKAFQSSSGTTRGKISTEQELSAPSDIAAADQAIGILDQIVASPALEMGTGFSSYGNAIRGTPGYDFQNLVEQAKSGAFLTAIDQLRGMGALSNAEGSAATAAITRMDTATSKEAFLKAVEDYRAIVDAGRKRAAARIGQPAAPSTEQPRTRYKFNPETGELE